MDARKLRVLSKSCCHDSVPPPLGVKEQLFVLLMRLCFLAYWSYPVLSFRYGPSSFTLSQNHCGVDVRAVTAAVRGAENMNAQLKVLHMLSHVLLEFTALYISCPQISPMHQYCWTLICMINGSRDQCITDTVALANVPNIIATPWNHYWF